MKPRVYWDGDDWVAALDHISWCDRTEFDTWDKALDHALWIGHCAAAWSTNG